jgi:ATP adenylyltransferase
VLDILWAQWRNTYLKSIADGKGEECLFCRLPAEPEKTAHILEVSQFAFTALNRYPYTSGHVMAAPLRHTADLGDLTPEEITDLWHVLARAEQALRATKAPDGFNMGANLGRAAGAGVPGHLHLHLVPRWAGDTNFTTVTGGARVMPQSLDDTWSELRSALEEA